MKIDLPLKSAEIIDEVRTIREHLHQHPELSFQEHKTCEFVEGKLREYGIPTERKATTGVVGKILVNPSYRWIALRADLDALPIQEENKVVYKSKNEGVMHACGHDVHTAILLGTAQLLKNLVSELKVNVLLIFQPGEEKLPGGASLLIQDGVLENPVIDEIYALHVFPELEAGKVGLKSGMYMASCDEIYIKVNGKGGHGAMPHQNIDPILISAHLITSLQQIVSRNCPPEIPSVLSFGRIEGLGATNVIPNFVKLQGTFRTMDEAWRKKAHELIIHQSESLCKSLGGSAEITIEIGYPYLENDPSQTERTRALLKRNLGDKNVIDLPIRMTGEDFAFYSQRIPATFIRIGTRNEAKGIVFPVHNSKFDIDPLSLRIGIQTLASICLEAE